MITYEDTVLEATNYMDGETEDNISENATYKARKVLRARLLQEYSEGYTAEKMSFCAMVAAKIDLSVPDDMSNDQIDRVMTSLAKLLTRIRLVMQADAFPTDAIEFSMTNVKLHLKD